MLKAKPLTPSKCKKLKGYTWERKYDGSRTIFKGGQLLSERGISQNYKYPHIVKALGGLDAVLDGEICILPNGTVHDLLDKTNWSKAQYVVFDVLEFEGENLRGKPLIERQSILRDRIFGYIGSWRDVILPFHFVNFEEGWKIVLKEKWEGLIGKRIDSPYSDKDDLTPDRKWCWIKVKHWKEAKEEVIDHDEGSVKGAFILAHQNDKGEHARISALSPEIVAEYHKMRREGRVFAEFNYLNMTSAGSFFQPRLVRLTGGDV